MTRQPTEKRWFDEVRALTETLVAIPTISPDAEAENRCADRIAALLSEEGVGLAPERWPTGDGRHSIACLLRGESPANDGRTVILMGHYDIVGVEEFKPLDPSGTGAIAFAPDLLREALLASLRAAGCTPDADAALRDLEEPRADGPGWRWMFGRGSVDMKSGVAAHIAVIRQLWHEREQLAGNVVFLACPDEENESAGILSAVPRLLGWQSAHGLRYLGVINTDYTSPRGADESERYIYTGVVGKLLPSFYIIGDPTHVGEPFRGLDASQIAAELVLRLHLNAGLSDSWPAGAREPSEVAVPPVTLKLRDLKSGYNVQTAAEAFVYVNWLTYSRAPGQALQSMQAAAREALDAALDRRAAQSAVFAGERPAAREERAEPPVLSFADLCRRVREERGWSSSASDDPLAAWLSELAEKLRASVSRPLPEWAVEAHLASAADSRELSRLLVAELAREARVKGPAIVVFFSPPYYPHIQPQQNEIAEAIGRVLAQLRDLGASDPADPPLKRKFQAAVPAPAEPPIQVRGFYPYIADLSYVRLDSSVRPQLPALIDNMPLFGRGYTLDFDAMQALDCPVVNIGPFGKNAHGLYECVDMPYSFEVVPQLVYETVCEALAQSARGESVG